MLTRRSVLQSIAVMPLIGAFVPKPRVLLFDFDDGEVVAAHSLEQAVAWWVDLTGIEPLDDEFRELPEAEWDDYTMFDDVYSRNPKTVTYREQLENDLRRGTGEFPYLFCTSNW